MIHVDSLKKLKAALPALRAELKDPEAFKEFYFFVFEFGRRRAHGPSIPAESGHVTVAACGMEPEDQHRGAGGEWRCGSSFVRSLAQEPTARGPKPKGE